MNLAQFRTAFYANCPQTQTTIVAKALKSSDNWASVIRDNGQKDVIIFHFEGRTFADFLAYFEKSAFYFCDNIEIETRTRAGYLEVFIYALKGLLSLACVKQNNHKRAQAAQEAAELDQQQAEYEAAQAENEAEEVAPEFIGLEFPTLVHNAEADEFVTNLGTYPFLNGKISYKWGSYTYLCNSQGGVFCQGETIAEDVESAQDAYEIAREHFYNWERTQIQSAQQSDANTPQVADISADITYININQSPDLGETTAEQMQDNTQQEDAETGEPFLKLAHPESLTDAEIKDFFEQFDLDTYGAFKIGSGGSMWKFIPANIDTEEQTVIFYFKNPYSFDCGVPILAKYFQCEEAEYRAAYTAFYEHHQKIAGVPIHKETACTLGIPTGVEAAERQIDYILHHDIRCECLGLFGEYLDNARVVLYRCSLTKKPKYKAYQEINGQLFYISNVNYLRPKSDLSLHRAGIAILEQQASLIKNPSN
jgi:hypothetical protein